MGSIGAELPVQPEAAIGRNCPLRWFIAAAAAQALLMSAHPLSLTIVDRVGATPSIEEGAVRWCISLVLMCR